MSLQLLPLVYSYCWSRGSSLHTHRVVVIYCWSTIVRGISAPKVEDGEGVVWDKHHGSLRSRSLFLATILESASAIVVSPAYWSACKLTYPALSQGKRWDEQEQCQ